MAKTHLSLLDSMTAALFKISELNPCEEMLSEVTSIEALSNMDDDLWSIIDNIEEMKNEGWEPSG